MRSIFSLGIRLLGCKFMLGCHFSLDVGMKKRNSSYFLFLEVSSCNFCLDYTKLPREHKDLMVPFLYLYLVLRQIQSSVYAVTSRDAFGFNR